MATEALESLSNGRVVSEIVDGTRRFDVVLRLSDEDRTHAAACRTCWSKPRRAGSRSA